MLTLFILVAAFVAVMLAFGAADESDGFSFVALISLIISVLGIAVMAGDGVNERWREWADCESGVTTIDEGASTIVIDDCDAYYRLPEEKDDE